MWIFLFAIFHYYTGFIGFFGYMMSLRAFNRPLLKYEIIFGLTLLLFFIVQYFRWREEALVHARFFWGWFLFYFAFKGVHLSNTFFKRILIILSLLVIVEACLVNTVVSVSAMPNYPSGIESVSSGHYTAPGAYQRPYSFGGNSSVTPVLLLSLMVLIPLGFWSTLLPLLAVLISASTTGYLVLFIFIVLKLRKHLNLFRLLILILSISSGVLILFTYNKAFYNFISIKISFAYLAFIYEYINIQWLEAVNFPTFWDFLFGNNYIPYNATVGFGSDNGAFSFIFLNGFLGVLLFLSFIAITLKEKCILPVVLLIIGTFHYPVIFFIPGQMLFGYLLSRKSEEARLLEH